MRERLQRYILLVVLCGITIFINVKDVQAAGKYDEKLYQDVLNYPDCYSGEVEYERAHDANEDTYATLDRNEDLKYIIKDVTGDGIKEFFVMDRTHLFIYTQKYNKKTKKMKLSLMTVLATNVNELGVYSCKINGKRYVGIDWIYTGTGITAKSVFRVKGNKLLLQDTLRHIGTWQGSYADNYTRNNEEISKKKYKKYIKKYFAKKYKLKYKKKSVTVVSTPKNLYTIAEKIEDPMVIIGGYAKKNVWTSEARTYMAAYARTRLDTEKKKEKLSAVKKEMQNLFGRTDVKFSKKYPYNTMKKKGKWVTSPYGEFGDEVAYGDVLDTYKIGKDLYRCRYASYTQNPNDVYNTDRYNLRIYYIMFKKSKGAYGYIIKDIREIKESKQTSDTSTDTPTTDKLYIISDTCQAFYDGYNSGEPWYITGKGLGICGTFHYSRNITQEEKDDFGHGGKGYEGTDSNKGNLLKGEAVWSGHQGKYMIDLPEDISAGRYVYYIYQVMEKKEVGLTIEFQVVDTTSGGKKINILQVK